MIFRCFIMEADVTWRQAKKECMKSGETAQLTVSYSYVLPWLPDRLKHGSQTDEGVSDGDVGRLWIQLCSV